MTLEAFLIQAVGGLIALQMIIRGLHMAGILPIYKLVPRSKIGGANGTNTALYVYLANDMNAKKERAVKGQEFYESDFKSWLFNLFMRVVSKETRRNMELMGHAVEIALYPPDEQGRVLRDEAKDLKAGYNGLFSDWSIEEIEAGLRRNLGPARRWLKGRKI